MDIKWLEDFLVLAETRSFSRAAQERHITQSAFSRRILALEAWVDAKLVDRGTYPVALTPAGNYFWKHAAEAVRQLSDVRVLLRSEPSGETGLLHVAAGHTLAATFFPHWLSHLQRQIGPLSTRLLSTNVHDATLALVESGCDILLCYHHTRAPIGLDSARHASALVGHELLVPVSVPGPSGTPLHALTNQRAGRIPLIAYSASSYLGRATDVIFQRRNAKSLFQLRTIAARSDAVMALALEGLGLAWLPERLVDRALAERRLLRAGDDRWTLQLEIRAIRILGDRKPILDRVWATLNDGSPIAERNCLDTASVAGRAISRS